MFGAFVGMRVRLTKKVLEPELVQEATGEIVEIVFHPDERFGDPSSSHLRPSDAHEAWERGWTRCDKLPLHIAVRFDGCHEDCTGLGKPGVWHLIPRKDTWEMPIETIATIDHPGAPCRKRIKQNTRTKKPTLEVASCQIPLTHEDDATFQNWQGKTARGPEGQPKGFVIDLYRPSYMGKEEYFQHVYMSLGRGQKLEWELFRNFPADDAGDLDWSVFESGPPAYLCEFLRVLEEQARKTYPKLVRAQRELGLPAFEALPACPADPENPGRYLYDPAAWGFAGRCGLRKRVRQKDLMPAAAQSFHRMLRHRLHRRRWLDKMRPHSRPRC